VQGFVKEFGIAFPIVIDNTGDLIDKYRAQYHPHSLFIDTKGIIRGIVPGTVSPEIMKDMLSKIL
jgi:hypothetical protein